MRLALATIVTAAIITIVLYLFTAAAMWLVALVMV